MRPTGPPQLRGVENVLESLRRGQRQLARDPKRAVEVAVKQLLSLGRVPAPQVSRPGGGPDGTRTFRVDDLAHASGVTVRNIRAYQERGLLHPPERVGRTAIFDESHLSRLRIISSMLERGYTSVHILEMLSAWENGRDLADVLGLEKALIPPLAVDQPETVTLAAARELAGGAENLELLVDAGLVELRGAKARLQRPQLLEAFARMRGHGMSTESLIGVHLAVLADIDRITHTLVSAGASQVGSRFITEVEPSSDEVSELVEMLAEFRSLAATSVMATLTASMDATIENLLTDYLAQFVGHSDADAG